MNSVLKLKNTTELQNIFKFLGETDNLLEDNKIHMDTSNAELSFYILKIQLIKSYMTHYLRNTFLKLTNNYIIEEEPFIPSTGKLILKSLKYLNN